MQAQYSSKLNKVSQNDEKVYAELKALSIISNEAIRT